MIMISNEDLKIAYKVVRQLKENLERKGNSNNFTVVENAITNELMKNFLNMSNND